MWRSLLVTEWSIAILLLVSYVEMGLFMWNLLQKIHWADLNEDELRTNELKEIWL